jgi:hypothetical protein
VRHQTDILVAPASLMPDAMPAPMSGIDSSAFSLPDRVVNTANCGYAEIGE